MAVILLGAWMAVTTVHRLRAPAGFVLEVPATHLSVGQQFQPLLVAEGGDPSDAPAVTVDLLDASGRRLSSQPVPWTAPAPPLALPRAGDYRLRATSGEETETIALAAQPEPPSTYGGVVGLAGVDLAPGIGDYLRQHSFAVTDITRDAVAPSPLYLVGDPRLDGAQPAAAYAQVWHQVAMGSQALLLEPPPAGIAALWPIAAPLRPPQGACDDDLAGIPLDAGLADASWHALLAPALGMDLSQQSQFDLYHWDGTRLARPNRRVGYAGCHVLLSYRYGQGWVTVSTLPLLQHFQDVRARIVLMNLIKAVMRRKRYAPASPGLQWVTEHRLQAELAHPSAPLAQNLAAYYRAAPPSGGGPAPAPVLVPPVSATGTSCWTAPAGPQAGARLQLDWHTPQPVRALTLDFGPQTPRYTLEASADGRHWTPLASPAALPAEPLQAFRLTIISPGAWRLCRFSVQ